MIASQCVVTASAKKATLVFIFISFFLIVLQYSHIQFNDIDAYFTFDGLRHYPKALKVVVMCNKKSDVMVSSSRCGGFV
jgi:hypothetical protein